MKFIKREVITNMSKIIFACQWGKNKKRAWSGTYYGLYTALQNYYDIENFDLSYSNYKYNPIIAFNYIKEKALRQTCFYDFGIGRLKAFNKVAVTKFSHNQDEIIVQFGECPNVPGIKSFVYQDLHVGYVKKMYNYMPEIFKISGYQHLRKKAIYRREKVQRDFYSNVTGIFTMGKWLEKELIEVYGMPKDRVFHVGGGYNVDPLKIDTSVKKGNKILFVGRDFIRKNGPLVVEAFKIAKAKRSDLELYIAGPENLNINHDGIFCLGDLNKTELADYFNLCDIFCMPSLFEAYGLVFAEALTFGLPCIGRNAYEMPYFIEEGQTGYLLHKQDAHELSDLMLDLICNKYIKDNVISKRDWYIQEYSWDTVARRIRNVIEMKRRSF